MGATRCSRLWSQASRRKSFAGMATGGLAVVNRVGFGSSALCRTFEHSAPGMIRGKVFVLLGVEHGLVRFALRGGMRTSAVPDVRPMYADLTQDKVRCTLDKVR